MTVTIGLIVLAAVSLIMVLAMLEMSGQGSEEEERHPDRGIGGAG